MPNNPSQFESHQPTEKIVDEIHGRIASLLENPKQDLKELGKGALLGGILTAIAAPLALVSGPQITATVLSLLAGVSGSVWADIIRRYTEAPDENARDKILRELRNIADREGEKTDQLLIAAQHLIEKSDLHTDILQRLDERARSHLFEHVLAPTVKISDERRRRKFVEQVGELLQFQGFSIQRDFRVDDGDTADFLVSKRSGLTTSSQSIVHCVSTAKGRATKKHLGSIGFWTADQSLKNRVHEFVLVSDNGLSSDAKTYLEKAGWHVTTYHRLLDELIDFKNYLSDLIFQFEHPQRKKDDLPGVGAYYVPLIARQERGEDSQAFDLYDFVLGWMHTNENQKVENFVEPLMILGEYGTGKSTFARKLAAGMAREVQLAAEAAAEERWNGALPRIPILINLIDYLHVSKLEDLITLELSKKCQSNRSMMHVFRRLNEHGRFLLILDGLDEMAVEAESNIIEGMIRSIEQLANTSQARVLVTGRPEFFMSQKELKEHLWPGNPLAERLHTFEAVRIKLWESWQIDRFLQQIVPYLNKPLGPWDDYKRRIQRIEGLDDLSERAVLLYMMARTLHDFDPDENISRIEIYDKYLRAEIDRQQKQKQRRFLIPSETRFKMLKALAAESFSTDRGGILYEEARKMVTPLLAAADQKRADKISAHTREFLSCSFLRPGPDDLFVFSHRSFRGYFAAQQLAPHLIDGTAAPQPLDDDCIRFLQEILIQTCDLEWYQQQTTESLDQSPIPNWLERDSEGRFFSELPSGHKVEMVFVPPGPFILGNEGEWPLDPAIAVLQTGVWIDRTPVTVGQFHAFVEDTNYKTEAEKGAGGFIFTGREWEFDKKASWRDPFASGASVDELESHPVAQVSWNDANEFAKWAGKMLPGEKQWEKTARGIDGRQWPWGNVWDRTRCNSASTWANADLFDREVWEQWFEGDYKKNLKNTVMTQPVDRYKKGCSPFGGLDFAGNVWEWCSDVWPNQENARVLRGGAWRNPPQLVTCSSRDGLYAVNGYLIIGFRCARTR